MRSRDLFPQQSKISRGVVPKRNQFDYIRTRIISKTEIMLTDNNNITICNAKQQELQQQSFEEIRNEQLIIKNLQQQQQQQNDNLNDYDDGGIENSIKINLEEINNNNNIEIKKTFNQLSLKESNRQTYENLEMRRLGLPTEFSSSKQKRQQKWKKQRQRQRNNSYDQNNYYSQNKQQPLNRFQNRVFHNSSLYPKSKFNQFKIEPIINDNENDYKHDNDNFGHESQSPQQYSISQEHEIDQIQQQQTLNNNDNVDNQKMMTIQQCVQDVVEEFPSMALTISESFDTFDTSTSFTTMVDSTTTGSESNSNSDAYSSNHSCSSDNDYDNDYDDQIDLDFVPLDSQRRNKKKCNHKKKKNKLKNRLGIYWRQRFILFSRFNEGIKLDRESWYSVTPEAIAEHIAERVENILSLRYPGRSFVVMDPFCGAGGNIIQFALRPMIKKVYAIDIDPKKIEMAKHNAKIYECDDKIEFICGDFFQIIQFNKFKNLIDACFYSPPWGGPDYRKKKKYSLNEMIPNGFDICRHTARYLTKNIIMLVPRNFDENELQLVSQIVYKEDQSSSSLSPVLSSSSTNSNDYRMIELERNMIFNKVKTMTVYFGDTINNLQLNASTKVIYE